MTTPNQKPVMTSTTHIKREEDNVDAKEIRQTLEESIEEYTNKDNSKVQVGLFIVGREAEAEDTEERTTIEFDCAMMGPPPMIIAALIDSAKLITKHNPVLGILIVLEMSKFLSEEARKHAQGLTDAQLDKFDKLLDEVTKGKLNDTVTDFLATTLKANQP